MGLLDEALGSYRYVDIAVLPEYFSFVPENKDTPIIEEYNEEIKEMLATRAKAYDTYIIGGTVANKQEDGNIYTYSSSSTGMAISSVPTIRYIFSMCWTPKEMNRSPIR